jgi:antitoxin component YwqK of YwqJK toxin-antitoxin module
MRVVLMLILVSFFSTLNSACQEKIWFDIDENRATKEKAIYYRILSKGKKENKIIVDYYISGKKAKEFYFIKGKKNGKYVEFYTSGEVKTTGEFGDGVKEGMWKTYYSNGKMKEKGKYTKGEKTGVWKLFYKNN